MRQFLKAKAAFFCTTFLIFVFVLVTVIIRSSPVQAVSLDECEKNPSADVGGCIDLFSQKITDLGSQKKTLSSQIIQFDTQIKLTQLKISEAQATIEKLEKEISALGFRIGYVTQSIDQLEKLVRERIIATYEQSYVSNFELVLTSSNFSDLILRLQYLRQVQENDKKILSSLQQTRSNYANQKDERETKQAAIEENKKKLEGLRAGLDSQKAEKQTFLEATKNDENRFQKLLQQALAERKAIVAAFAQAVSRLNNGEGINVNKGGTVALVGNSGAPDCSSGPHLHFTVLQNSSPVSPAQKLRDISPAWDNAPDGPFSFSGDWDWPISSPKITQGFGMTYWAKLGWYDGNIHDGIDMTGGPTIVAPKSGKVIYGSTVCGHSALKYAAIKHDDEPSIITLYLHIQ